MKRKLFTIILMITILASCSMFGGNSSKSSTTTSGTGSETKPAEEKFALSDLKCSYKFLNKPTEFKDPGSIFKIRYSDIADKTGEILVLSFVDEATAQITSEFEAAFPSNEWTLTPNEALEEKLKDIEWTISSNDEFLSQAFGLSTTTGSKTAFVKKGSITSFTGSVIEFNIIATYKKEQV